MKIITFFNNKGGVGKTTTVYHIAWMLKELALFRNEWVRQDLILENLASPSAKEP